MEWSPISGWSAWAAIAAVLYAVVAWRTLRAPGEPSRGRRVAWLVLRGAFLMGILVVLRHPHRVDRREFREPMDIAVLVDDSGSMQLKDADDGPLRLAVLREKAKVFETLADDEVQVRWYALGDSAHAIEGADALTGQARQSRIGAALEAVLGDQRERELGAVFLLSDGQTRNPEAARAAARQLRKARIPLYTTLIGTEAESADVIVEDVRGRQDSPYDALIRFQGVVRTPGMVGQEGLLRIRCEGRILHEAFMAFDDVTNRFEVVVDSPFNGFHAYTVEVPEMAGERLGTNNDAVIGVELLDRKIRVINMEGTPGSGHYLENALETDPDIEVTSFFFPQSSSVEQSRQVPFTVDANGRKIYNIAHPVKGYPRSMEEMLQYDVVINSDIYKEAFTPAQLSNTVALVEDHGGGFVMVGGSTAFGAGHYDETVIDRLMPVDVYGNEDVAWGSFPLLVPDAALEHPVMALGSDREETRRIWSEAFPGFTGQNKVNRPKPGAQVLASNARSNNQYGPLVVFAVQQIGRGRTMAFTSDTTQSWGAGFQNRFGTAEDPTVYYRRFWNQTVRWLAADRIRRKNGELRVTLDQAAVLAGDRVGVLIPFAPTYPGAVLTAEATGPGGVVRQVALVRDDVGRLWKGALLVDAPGQWTVRARLPRPEMDPLFAHALVVAKSDAWEQQSTAANGALMRELAAGGSGRVLEGEDPASVLTEIDRLGSRLIEYRRRSLWDRAWVWGALMGLLALEWVLRRRWSSV